MFQVLKSFYLHVLWNVHCSLEQTIVIKDFRYLTVLQQAGKKFT